MRFQTFPKLNPITFPQPPVKPMHVERTEREQLAAAPGRRQLRGVPSWPIDDIPGERIRYALCTSNTIDFEKTEHASNCARTSHTSGILIKAAVMHVEHH